MFIIDTHIRPDVDEKILHLRPEALDNIKMEDLIKEYLTSTDNVSHFKGDTIYHYLVYDIPMDNVL